MATTLDRHKHAPSISHSDQDGIAFTGNVELTNPYGRNIIAVSATLRANASAEAVKAVQLTWETDTSDRTKGTLYAWKPTGAGDTTPIAATAEVTVDVIMITE